jgi:hypothetical protein
MGYGNVIVFFRQLKWTLGLVLLLYSLGDAFETIQYMNHPDENMGPSKILPFYSVFCVFQNFHMSSTSGWLYIYSYFGLTSLVNSDRYYANQWMNLCSSMK